MYWYEYYFDYLIWFLLHIFVDLQDCSTICDPADLDLCWKHAYEKPPTTSAEFVNLANILMEEENLIVPSNVDQALSLYFSLTNLIENIERLVHRTNQRR